MKKKRRLRLKDYLIPHAGNTYKPLLFTAGGVAVVLIGLVLLQCVYLFSTHIGFNRSSFLASVLPGVLTDLTNTDRAAAGVEMLQVDPLLQKAAQLKAEDMAAKGYFAHIAPDGKTPWFWLEKVGYSYTYAGENLAIDFTDSEKIEEAWMASPKHHANIVKPQYTRIGIGIAQGTFEGKDTTFVVQFFAKPKAAPVARIPKGVVAQGAVAVNTQSGTVATGTERVLGAEVSPEDSSFAAFAARVIASPLHTFTYILGALMVFFVLLLLIAIFKHVRVQYLEVIVGGLLIVSALLGLVLYNTSTSTGQITTDQRAGDSNAG